MSKSIETLECACCGASTKGRQWWNRDTGYGACTRCALASLAKYGGEVTTDCYGVRGFNWDIKETIT